MMHRSPAPGFRRGAAFWCCPLARIAEVERGDSNPRLLTLSKLAHALGVTVSDLLVDNLHAPPGTDAPSGAGADTDDTPRNWRVM